MFKNIEKSSNITDIKNVRNFSIHNNSLKIYITLFIKKF